MPSCNAGHSQRPSKRQPPARAKSSPRVSKDTHLTGGLAPHAGQPQKSQTATPPVATTPIAYPYRLHASPALRSQARRLFHLFRLLSLGRRHAHVSNRLARGTPWQRVQRKVPAVRVVVWVMGIHSRGAVGRHDAAPGALPASTTLLRQPTQARSRNMAVKRASAGRLGTAERGALRAAHAVMMRGGHSRPVGACDGSPSDSHTGSSTQTERAHGTPAHFDLDAPAAAEPGGRKEDQDGADAGAAAAGDGGKTSASANGSTASLATGGKAGDGRGPVRRLAPRWRVGRPRGRPAAWRRSGWSRPRTPAAPAAYGGGIPGAWRGAAVAHRGLVFLLYL